MISRTVRGHPAFRRTIPLSMNLVYSRRRIPEAAPKVSQRSEVRAATVVRYPFRIFYRVREDTVDILHIRHTSRRPLGRAD
jgi:plasmid stabilization system protein ParE